jgi:hypothetical protein
MYDAAKRNTVRLRALTDASVPKVHQMRRLKKTDPARYCQMRERYRPTISAINRDHPIVNRADRDGKRFVMSLAIGETVCMRHKHTTKPGYFVVFQVDKEKIWFKAHWDARRVDSKGVENPRQEIDLSPSQLKGLGTETDKPPCKVRVGPLGDFKILTRD